MATEDGLQRTPSPPVLARIAASLFVANLAEQSAAWSGTRTIDLQILDETRKSLLALFPDFPDLTEESIKRIRYLVAQVSIKEIADFCDRAGQLSKGALAMYTNYHVGTQRRVCFTVDRRTNVVTVAATRVSSERLLCALLWIRGWRRKHFAHGFYRHEF